MTADNAPGIIHAKLIDLMQTVGAIGKNRKNEFHKFMFRGIDDVMQEVHRAQIKEGVTILPSVLSRTTGVSGKMTTVALEVRYRFTAIEDGSYADIVVWGEAADAGDKSTSKAMSMALKYGLIQALMIPTEDIADGDPDSPEVDRSQPVPRPTAQPSKQELQFVAQVTEKVAAAGTREDLNALWAQVKKATDSGLTEGSAKNLTDQMKRRAQQLEPTAA